MCGEAAGGSFLPWHWETTDGVLGQPVAEGVSSSSSELDDSDWDFVPLPQQPRRSSPWPRRLHQLWSCLGCMGLLSVVIATTYSIGVLVWVEVVDLRYNPINTSVVEVSMAPQPWERRFVQTSETTGQEVLLLRRSNEPGYWMATTATEGMVKVAVNDRRCVRTAIQGPKAGVAYSPIGALSAPARGAVMTQADNLAVAGTAGMRILTINQGRGTGVRRYLGMVLTTPAAGWRLVRWSMRRPSRAVGFLGMMWIMTEALQVAGFFDYVREKILRGQEAVQRVRDKVGEASEFAAEVIEVLRATYAGIEEYIEPWKLPFLGIAVCFIYKWFKDAEVSETPLSTPEVSPASSSCETPPEDPQSRAIESLGVAVASQNEMMEQVIRRLGDMQTKHNEDADRALEKEMIRNARSSTAAEEQAHKHGKTWDEMRSRMEHFEKILKEDRGDAAGGPTLLSPTKGEEEADDTKMYLPETPRLPRDTQGDMSILIKKLKRQAKSPQEVFVEALEDFAEQDKETWATQFPPGYRERVAPNFLGEIYASGKTAKQWAKDWVRDKTLGDCNEAREIIPACASIDSIFLVDQTAGAINMINVERLARKVLGIKYGFAEVSKEADWRKPSNAKTWKSRVDRETWKRTDPNVDDKEHIFMNRKAEDEMRTEMDREASMLKAKAKLAEREGK